MGKKVVLITGSSRGIGRACALCFAKKGYHVVINGRKENENLRNLKEEIEKEHVECMICAGDVGKEGVAEEIISRIQERFGTLSVLVNNAAISYVGLLTDLSTEDWNRIISTNLTSLFLTCRQAVPVMLQKKEGKILNISSVWGIYGASCEVAYSATKGGVNAFTKALAKELAPSNIQVNAIAFGTVDTEMNQFLSEEEKDMLVDEIPAGRMAKAGEAAEFIVRIAEAEDYLTGQVIPFDGGWI